jgi:hypothetical protein
MELILAGEHLELIEELEFYEWLDTGAAPAPPDTVDAGLSG